MRQLQTIALEELLWLRRTGGGDEATQHPVECARVKNVLTVVHANELVQTAHDMVAGQLNWISLMPQHDAATRPDRITQNRGHRGNRSTLPRSGNEHRGEVVGARDSHFPEVPQVARHAMSAVGTLSIFDADQGRQVGEPRIHLEGVQRDVGKRSLNCS